MTGATVLTLAGVVPGGVALALIPLVVGLLSAFVAYGRWRLGPHRGAIVARRNAAAGQLPPSRSSSTPIWRCPTMVLTDADVG